MSNLPKLTEEDAVERSFQDGKSDAYNGNGICECNYTPGIGGRAIAAAYCRGFLQGIEDVKADAAELGDPIAIGIDQVFKAVRG